jgi:hypothetical protein
MNVDTLLLAIIIGGIALTGAYLRSEYVWGRRLKAADRRREIAQRELHLKRTNAVSPEPGPAGRQQHSSGSRARPPFPASLTAIRIWRS